VIGTKTTSTRRGSTIAIRNNSPPTSIANFETGLFDVKMNVEATRMNSKLKVVASAMPTEL
jgi:hypothetical protein